jgi:transcriptional regulator of heat shock response
MYYWKQFKNESLEKEMEARARVRDLELYVAHLEQYNTILHEVVHRLHDLMNPNHQPQAIEDDVGAVVVRSEEEGQEEEDDDEDPKEVEPMLESWEEASHVTSMCATENEDGVIVISDDDEG